MSTSAKAVRFDDDSMWVDLDDGRRMAVPLAGFPRLLAATCGTRCKAAGRAGDAGKCDGIVNAQGAPGARQTATG